MVGWMRRLGVAELRGLKEEEHDLHRMAGIRAISEGSDDKCHRKTTTVPFPFVYPIHSLPLHDTHSAAEDCSKEEGEGIRYMYNLNDRLHDELNACKNEISHVAYNRRWDRVKKLTNDYELVSSSCFSSIDGGWSAARCGVSAYNPVSRSFYKLWEIMVRFHTSIFDGGHSAGMRVMFLAEGPGGFVEAFSTYRRRFFPPRAYAGDSLHGMTLKSPEKRVPYWNPPEHSKTRLRVHAGEDGTGDICNVRNVAHMVARVGRQACDLVTADGGFDFSHNYNTQEEVSTELVSCETFAALHLLRTGGHFVLKIYDVRADSTFRLIHLLRSLFANLYFVKPLTSRPANSEKYLVCIGFRGAPRDVLSSFREDIEKKTINFLWASRARGLHDMPAAFVREVVYYNVHYVSRQTLVIRRTLELIAAETKRRASADGDEEQAERASCSLLVRQLSKCVRWCDKFKIPVKNAAKEALAKAIAANSTNDLT